MVWYHVTYKNAKGEGVRNVYTTLKAATHVFELLAGCAGAMDLKLMRQDEQGRFWKVMSTGNVSQQDKTEGLSMVAIVVYVGKQDGKWSVRGRYIVQGTTIQEAKLRWDTAVDESKREGEPLVRPGESVLDWQPLDELIEELV